MEPAVVDPGSLLLKAGFAQPDGDPPIVIGSAMMTVAAEEEFSEKKLSVNDIEPFNPIERGMVKDWDAVEDLWRYVLYTGLGWEPGSEGQLLIAEALLTPKVARERMVQIMFENFSVAGLYAVEQALLSLYAMGRITGVAVDIGHGKLDIAPVWEGTVQHNAVRRFEIGGQELNLFLKNELAKSNPNVSVDLTTVEQLKELYATVAEDQMFYSDTAVDCETVEHTLPDGQVISVGRERYTVGEALFQPSLLGIEDYGIVEQTLRSISACLPVENHRQLVENVVLCGGTSTMSGLETRFQKEAHLLGTPSFKPCLIRLQIAVDIFHRKLWRESGTVKEVDARIEKYCQQPPEYMPENTTRYSAWIGGAILAKVVFPQHQHITKAEYDETGPTIVHRKCY